MIIEKIKKKNPRLALREVKFQRMERWKCSEMDRKVSCGVRRDMWGWDYHRAEWALLCAKGRPSEQRPGDWHEHGCCEDKRGHHPGWWGMCLRERRRSEPNAGETGGLWFWLSRVSLGLQCPRSSCDKSWSGSGVGGSYRGSSQHPHATLSSWFQFYSNQHSVFLLENSQWWTGLISLQGSGSQTGVCITPFRDLILNEDSWDLSPSTHPSSDSIG